MRKSVSVAALSIFCHATHAANLSDVYAEAVLNDPVLGAAKQNYEARKEGVPQARSALLPNGTLSAYRANTDRELPGASPDINFDSFGEDAWQAQLQQPFFDVEALYNYRGAKERARQAEFDYATAEQQLIVRVTQAYLDILRAQAQVESTRAEEEAVKRQLEQVQQRFDVGLVAITDVLDARAAYDAAVVRRVQAEGDQSIFFETLTTLTGSRYSRIDRLAEALPIDNPEPTDQEEWVATALATNPVVQAARKQVDAAREDVRARLSGHLPTVDGIVSYNEFSTGGQNFLGDETNTTIYRLSLTLPIYQGGFTQSRVREARSRLVQSEEILRDTEWSVTRDTYNLLRAVSTDVVRVAARIRAIKSAESALEATQTGYEVGTRNIVDVLQAQQRLYLSQFDYADSRYRYVNDLLFLKQTAGTLAPADVERLASFSDAANPVTRIDQISTYEPPAEPSVP